MITRIAFLKNWRRSSFLTARRTLSSLAISLMLIVPTSTMQGATSRYGSDFDPMEQTPEAEQTAPQANPADVATLDSIIAALYDVISGPAGRRRDWDRLRSLFIAGGRLIPAGPRQGGGVGARVLDVEGYIKTSGPYLESNGFFEREIARRTETFGHIAHVFSTYEARHKSDDPRPFMRGINSIQLMNDGRRWWIVTVFWQAEGPGSPLPEKYLR